MRTTAAFAFLCFAGVVGAARPLSAAAPDSLPKVIVHADVSVVGENITLGEIAEITPSPQTCKASARLAATILGRAPLPGESRPLDRGDIMLKLRQAGIDPATVDLEGARTLTISQVGSASVENGLAANPQSGVSQQPVVLVRPGDEVDVVLVDGRVSVRTRAFAVSGGSLGDTISLRRDGSTRLLTATIIAAGEAQLEE